MKAIIENYVTYENAETEVGKENYQIALIEFNLILIFVKIALDKENLRDLLSDQKITNFVYGFGSSHMWVHQVVNGEPLKDRLMIVEF